MFGHHTRKKLLDLSGSDLPRTIARCGAFLWRFGGQRFDELAAHDSSGLRHFEQARGSVRAVG